MSIRIAPEEIYNWVILPKYRILFFENEIYIYNKTLLYWANELKKQWSDVECLTVNWNDLIKTFIGHKRNLCVTDVIIIGCKKILDCDTCSKFSKIYDFFSATNKANNLPERQRLRIKSLKDCSNYNFFTKPLFCHLTKIGSDQLNNKKISNIPNTHETSRSEFYINQKCYKDKFGQSFGTTKIDRKQENSIIFKDPNNFKIFLLKYGKIQIIHPVSKKY